MTTLMPETEVDIDLDSMREMFPYDDTDDGKNHKTHIVRPWDNKQIDGWMHLSGQDVVDQARMLGWEITALCGYKFIPMRNPEKYEACSQCIDIAGHIMSNQGE